MHCDYVIHICKLRCFSLILSPPGCNEFQKFEFDFNLMVCVMYYKIIIIFYNIDFNILQP
jgi:hypothetical protein